MMDLWTDVPAATLDILGKLVPRYHVCYRVSRNLAVVHGELRAVGFTIELAATHDHPKDPPFAGCDECVPVARALHDILIGVIPTDFRPSQFEAHDSPLTLHFPSAHAKRPELTASVQILHRDGAHRAIDDCETSCRDQIVARLKAIGASEGSWREPS